MLPSPKVSSLFLLTLGGFPAQSTATRCADAQPPGNSPGRDCKTARLCWTKGPSHHAPSRYLRKVGKKQTTYSTSMTQEGANNSCNQQFKEKSELKLLLGFRDVERVRSHAASQLLASLLVSPVLPGNQMNSSYSPAAAEPIAVAVKAAKPLPVPDHILFPQQTVMNQKSRLPKPAFACISCCPRRQAFLLARVFKGNHLKRADTPQ